MRLKRSKNLIIDDKKLSSKAAFGIAAGLILASGLAGSLITKSIVQDVVIKEKEVVITEFRDLPENRDLIYVYENERFRPEDSFKIITGDCILEGQTAYEASYSKQEAAITILRQAMSSDNFENEVASSGHDVTSAIASMRLECVSP